MNDWLFWLIMAGVFAGYLGYQEWLMRREDKRLRARMLEMVRLHDACNDRLLDRLDRVMERYEKARKV